MGKVYFGEFTTGRLHRLPFLGYHLLLNAIVIGLLLGLGLLVGAAERAIGGDIAETQAMLGEAFGETLGPVFVLIGVVLAIVVTIASFNVTAKRFRDIGLPGGWSVVAVILVSALLVIMVGQGASNLFGLVVALGLLLVPSDAVAGRA